MNWTVLTVKVVEGGENGPPVAGVPVTIQGRVFGDETADTLREETNREGIARFGPIRPGRYKIEMTTPLGLQLVSGAWPSKQREREPEVVLYPGAERDYLVVYPDIKPAAVSFQVELPPDSAVGFNSGRDPQWKA